MPTEPAACRAWTAWPEGLESDDTREYAVLYIWNAVYICVKMVNNGSGVMQLRFKEAGRFIEILKGGKLTRNDVVALIKEALSKNKIVDLN
jgi:hypothetical protein